MEEEEEDDLLVFGAIEGVFHVRVDGWAESEANDGEDPGGRMWPLRALQCDPRPYKSSVGIILEASSKIY